MYQTLHFLINSILLGVGLAMDAFSVSCANGLREAEMKKSRMGLIAGTYAAFQFFMPLIGWFCVRTAAERFAAFRPLIPWIALILLLLIGGSMLREGIHPGAEETALPPLSLPLLLGQGVATSIDALSVGFTIAAYPLSLALFSCGIIAAVTFCICIAGLLLGRSLGTKLAGKASILGGIILILVGVEIFLA